MHTIVAAALLAATPTPPLPEVTPDDLYRFPQRIVAQYCWSAAYRYRNDMATCLNRWGALSEEHAEYLTAWRLESEYLCSCWDALDNAQRASLKGNREAVLSQMQRLHRLLGEANYWRAEMPAVTPWWRSP